MSKFYDFIEIGTSDFDTEIQKATDNTIGLSIEPIKYYLDKLPNKLNIQKLEMAISNENGNCLIYYMPIETINKYNFPKWFRGCNSINDYHSTVYNTIKELDLVPEELIKSYIVEKKNFIYNI